MASWSDARRWFHSLGPAARVVVKSTRPFAGPYEPLHKYLRDRYANRVVLSFGEIEELLGFPLPTEARLAQDWWIADNAVAKSSWVLANRSAAVNLIAQVVVYDREEPPVAH